MNVHFQAANYPCFPITMFLNSLIDVTIGVDSAIVKGVGFNGS